VAGEEEEQLMETLAVAVVLAAEELVEHLEEVLVFLTEDLDYQILVVVAADHYQMVIQDILVVMADQE